MALDMPRVIVEYLQQNPGCKFTAREIAEYIFNTFPEENEKKKENSIRVKTDPQLIYQYSNEVAYQRLQLLKRYPQFKVTEDRPIKCYWQVDVEEVEIIEDKNEEEESIESREDNFEGRENSNEVIIPDGDLKEEDLYPIVREYLWYGKGIYPKRINEKKSSNKRGIGGNKWLHPDIVGMQDLVSDWHQEVRNLADHYSDSKVKLWSFEVKKAVGMFNVREIFFQAVSNSSWANLGYLVAMEIQDDAKREFQILSSLHGIGLIELNVESPAETQVVIPARERVGVDWATCNRLAEENSDFLQFLKLIRQFHQTDDPRKNDWDIPED